LILTYTIEGILKRTVLVIRVVLAVLSLGNFLSFIDMRRSGINVFARRALSRIIRLGIVVVRLLEVTAMAARSLSRHGLQ
jgi:hypothetical protein